MRAIHKLGLQENPFSIDALLDVGGATVHVLLLPAQKASAREYGAHLINSEVVGPMRGADCSGSKL